MLLASVGTLRSRLNQRETEAINTQVAAILESVTLYLEGVLGTSFLRVEDQKDYFHLDESSHLTNASYCRLRLSHGLVSDVAIDQDYGIELRVNESTGVVTLLANWSKGDDLTITYKKGLAAVEDADGNMVYQNVPKWLETAALVWSEAIFFSKFGDSEDVGNDSDYTTPPSGVEKILAEHDRYAASSLRAIV